jgi:phosphatidylserine decarboxylase
MMDHQDSCMPILSTITSYIQKRFAIAKEGIPIVLVLVITAVILWCITAVTNSTILFWLAVLLTIVTAGITFLFRNPHRTTPDLTDLDILSPADGKIVSIGPADEPQFLKRKALRVSIFLSLLDVHVNWLPVSGVVRHKQCSDGKFLPAYTDRASDKNKRVSVGIQCDDGFCMTVVQITGFVARRIRCYLTPGQHVKRGDRYGMICFGSRVDIFVPHETTITVKKGDRVRGGITVIGKKHNTHGKNKVSAA